MTCVWFIFVLIQCLHILKAWLQNFKACSICIMSECLFIHGWVMIGSEKRIT